jgi:hypothetical protein
MYVLPMQAARAHSAAAKIGGMPNNAVRILVVDIMVYSQVAAELVLLTAVVTAVDALELEHQEW